jgi:hypothetical protein
MNSTVQKLLVVTVLGVSALVVLRAARRDAPSDRSEEAGAEPNAKAPRLLLRRFWFDRMPKKRGDEVDAWIFLGGGIGLQDKGSSYRFGVDLFEFERRGSTLDLVWFHDKKQQSVAFSVVECHDKPPFDLCLDLKEPLRGQKRLWSFDEDADMDANVPWAREWRSSAEARARVIR